MNLDKDYKLIPMDEITDEAREIAVRWHEDATDWIGDKHKLASDIMNYAIQFCKAKIDKVYLSNAQMLELYKEMLEDIPEEKKAPHVKKYWNFLGVGIITDEDDGSNI